MGMVGFHLNHAPNACLRAYLLLSSLSEYRKHKLSGTEGKCDKINGNQSMT